MRCMALLLLLCLVGGAAADAMSEPQYSRNQLIYLNGPDTGSFQQDVQNYWNTYIEKGMSSTDANKTMSIWFNTFPLKFESPVKLGETTFAMGTLTAKNISPTVWTSMMLERETVYKFGLDRSSAYMPLSLPSSFRIAESGSASAQESQGQILTQSIITRLGV